VAGVLAGLRIVEMAGIGPVPFCGMMLADHGAEVIQVDRPGGRAATSKSDPSRSVLNRSRRSIVLDLKSAAGIDVLRDLVRSADGLIEGFRPGVMERLGVGPESLLALKPDLVYGRMTGWGQSGPYAAMAGHDINYVALSGVLDLLGRRDQQPTPPANLLGDFGGGGLMLAFGMLGAVLHARRTGEGQVVDCSIVEGTAVLSSIVWGFVAQARWPGPRGTNFLDTGAHYYDTYECADGRYVSIGALEPQFYATLLRAIGVSDDADFSRQNDPAAWPALKQKLAAVFRTRTRDEWCAVLDGTDACFAPVLSLQEAPQHPHNAARNSFIEVGGVPQPAPAPRCSATPADTPRAAGPPGQQGAELLRGLGYTQQQIDSLRNAGVVG
jgi:alpha-methylacyl-CoA racemase